MIFPIWQRRAQSSHLLAEACGNKLGGKATHTGTLDPMAEGVLVILTDEDRLVKGALVEWKKTYRFSILWGIKTDSGDRMGIIENENTEPLNFSHLQKTIDQFPQEYVQTIPTFSARRFAGKSGFDWGKTAEPPPQKTRTVQLSIIAFVDSYSITTTEVLQKHHDLVAQVTGDFRQQEILTNWDQHLEKNTCTFLVTEHIVTTSAGTYIRQLVQDIASQLGTAATTWSITRSANGPFEKEDCIDVEELEF